MVETLVAVCNVIGPVCVVGESVSVIRVEESTVKLTGTPPIRTPVRLFRFVPFTTSIVLLVPIVGPKFVIVGCCDGATALNGVPIVKVL